MSSTPVIDSIIRDIAGHSWRSEYVRTAIPGSQRGNSEGKPLPMRPNQPRQTKTPQLSNIDSAKRPQMDFGHEFDFWSDIAVVGGGASFGVRTSDEEGLIYGREKKLKTRGPSIYHIGTYIYVHQIRREGRGLADLPIHSFVQLGLLGGRWWWHCWTMEGLMLCHTPPGPTLLAIAIFSFKTSDYLARRLDHVCTRNGCPGPREVPQWCMSLVVIGVEARRRLIMVFVPFG